MARLARLAHRIVWVNPRTAATGYARCRRAWRPRSRTSTRLVSGHSVAALGEVFAAVAAEDD